MRIRSLLIAAAGAAVLAFTGAGVAQAEIVVHDESSYGALEAEWGHCCHSGELEAAWFEKSTFVVVG